MTVLNLGDDEDLYSDKVDGKTVHFIRPDRMPYADWTAAKGQDPSSLMKDDRLVLGGKEPRVVVRGNLGDEDWDHTVRRYKGHPDLQETVTNGKVVSGKSATKRALQAQQSRPKSKAQETFIAVGEDGTKTPIVRGDMTDEEWAATKKAAGIKTDEGSGQTAPPMLAASDDPSEGASAPPMTTVEDSEDQSQWASYPDSSRERQKRLDNYKALAQNEAYDGGGVFNETEMKMLRKMKPADAAEFMDERMQRRAWEKEQAAKAASEPADPSMVGQQSADLQLQRMLKPSGKPSGAPSKGMMLPEMDLSGMSKEQLARFGTQQMPEMDISPTSNQLPEMDLSGMSKEQLARYGTQQMPEMDISPEGTTFPTMDLTGQPSNEKPLPMVESREMPTMDLTDPSNPRLDLGPQGGGFAGPGGSLISQGLAGMSKGAMPPGPQTVSNPPNLQAGGRVSASTSTGSGLRVKGTIPGKADPTAALPEDPRITELKRNHDALEQITIDRALREEQKLNADMDLKQLAQVKQAQLDANFAKEQKVYEDTVNQQMDALKTLRTHFADLAKQSPDPNRFWNNKDAGQKFAAILAGACFGFTGQGLNYIQHMDQLVQQDVQNQAADLARKRELLGDQADLTNNIVAHAEKLGLKGMQKYNAAVAAMRGQLADQLEMNALKYQQQDVKARAMEAVAAMRQKNAETIAKIGKDAEAHAMEMKLKQAEINHRNMQTYELSVQAKAREAAAAGGGAKMQEMKPSQVQDLEGLLTLGDSIGRMYTQYNKQAGGKWSPVEAAAGAIGTSTDAARWQDASRQFHAQSIGGTLEGGKLTDSDYAEKYLPHFIPSAYETRAAAQNKANNLVQYAVDKYKNKLKALNAAQVQYYQLPSPEAFEAHLKNVVAASLSSERPAK